VRDIGASAEVGRSSERRSSVSWHEGWKVITTHPSMSGWGNLDDDVWELYHTDADRPELHDLAAEQPVKLRELVNLWYAEAGANGAFPLDDRSGLEIFATPRPQLSKPRNRYLYYPDVADVPESQAVNIRSCRCGCRSRATGQASPNHGRPWTGHSCAARRSPSRGPRRQLRRTREDIMIAVTSTEQSRHSYREPRAALTGGNRDRFRGRQRPGC
jgi:hypothetical protein